MKRFTFLALWAAALFPGGGVARAQQTIAVLPEPSTPVVAMEVLIATGPADEEAGRAGLAYLTARSAVAPIRPRLDSLGATVAVQPYKDAVGVALLAVPGEWEAAARILLLALFRDPVDSLATTRERASVVAELRGREANPADALAREVEAALFGTEHPWGRPAVGYASTIAPLTVADVDGFLRANFLPERAWAAAVGPVDSAEVRALLRPFVQGSARSTASTEAARPAESPVRREYNSITTWVSASYPFAASADVESLRLLAELALQSLSFGPQRRSVYNARSEVLPHPGGGELRLEVVVPPGEAERWAERIQQVVAGFAAEPLPKPSFEQALRRFRGERLLEISAPEERARLAVRSLFARGSAPEEVLPKEAGMDALSAERLQEAAGALGTPVLVFLGPDAAEED